MRNSLRRHSDLSNIPRRLARISFADGQSVLAENGTDRSSQNSSILPKLPLLEAIYLMFTTRETILSSLYARLLPLAALVLRDEVLPDRIPAAGLIILRDGQPGEPEVTLSPLRYHYQHRAELEVVVQAPNGHASTFDSLISSIGTALEADRTLGGLCDWIEPEAPASVDLPIEGAAALKAAVITVVVHYTTIGPLA